MGPFFVAPEDRQQPLTYQTGMRHVRELWEKASSRDEAMKYGLHSLRVTGYTLGKRGGGEALAVAQGGWHSNAHERYERFTLAQVVALPAAMLAAAGALAAAAVPPAPVVPVAAAPVANPVPVVASRPLPATRGGRSSARGSADSRPPAAGQSPAGAAATPPRRALTLANAVGRRVLAPAALWPRLACREHGGEGWEARILKVRTTTTDEPREEGLAEFVVGKTRSKGWEPMWIALSALRPLL